VEFHSVKQALDWKVEQLNRRVNEAESHRLDLIAQYQSSKMNKEKKQGKVDDDTLNPLPKVEDPSQNNTLLVPLQEDNRYVNVIQRPFAVSLDEWTRALLAHVNQLLRTVNRYSLQEQKMKEIQENVKSILAKTTNFNHNNDENHSQNVESHPKLMSLRRKKNNLGKTTAIQISFNFLFLSCVMVVLISLFLARRFQNSEK